VAQSIHQRLEQSALRILIAIADAHSPGMSPDLGGEEQEAQTCHAKVVCCNPPWSSPLVETASARLENEVVANKSLVDRRSSERTQFRACVYHDAFEVFLTERRAYLRLPYPGSRAIVALIGETTLNSSLNTHAPDQTGSRPRRLHCFLDLAAPTASILARNHFHEVSRAAGPK